MSAINVYASEEYWGEVFPGIYLVRLFDIREGYKAENGVNLWEGCFGLTIMNDPFVIFSTAPTKNVHFYEEIKDDYASYVLERLCRQEVWEKELTGDINDMYTLYKACLEGGYDKKYGSIGIWINQKVAEYIETHSPDEISKRIGL